MNKESLTGSIGVVSIIPDISKLKKKIGIDSAILKNSEKSDLYSLTQPMTETGRSALIQSNLRVYQEFKSRVAISRKLTVENVEKIAGGRVYLGEEAVKIGLADGILSYDEVVKKLAKDISIVKYRVKKIENKDISRSMKNYFFNLTKPFNMNMLLDNLNKTLFLYTDKNPLLLD